ncbi:hypothetical protein GE061_003928, partial [Apolygus lucorum]
RESLETALKDLLVQQQKDFEQMKVIISSMESRQNAMTEIVKQFAAIRQAHH